MGSPSFFEGNAYRILRLGAGVTISEAHEAAARMKRLVALDMLGDRADERDRLELGPISRTEIDINSAISRLQQPKSRLLDRLFWFHFPSERIDETKSSLLEARFRGEPQALVAILHDCALEQLVNVVPLELNEASAALWAKLLSTWHNVISDEAYWGLTSGIEERGHFEPVAFPSDIAELEQQSQKYILRELVRVAHGALDAGNIGGARALLNELIKLDCFGSLLPDAIEEIVFPLRLAISEGCQAIANARSLIKREGGEATGNLAICNSSVDIYRKTVEPALASLVRLLPENNPLVVQASRDGAKCLQGIAIDLTWAEDFSRSEKLHEEALKLAGEAPIASEIEAGLQEVKKTAKRQRLFAEMKPINSAPSLYSINGVGFTVYGSSEYDDETRSSVATYYFIVLFFPLLPIARYRVIRDGNNKYRFVGKLPLRKVDRWHLGLALAAIFGLVVWASADTASTSVASKSMTYAPRTTVSSPVTDRLGQLKRQIDAERAQYAAMDVRMKPVINQLSSYQSEIETIKKELQSMDAEQAVGRAPNEAYYNSRVRAHNDLLMKYRALLAENRGDLNKMIELENSDKAMVTEYNGLLRH